MAYRFNHLDPQQRGFLAAIYRSGQRQFDMHDTRPRWIEQLRESEFVETPDRIIWVIGAPEHMEVPKRAWKALELLSRKGKL